MGGGKRKKIRGPLPHKKKCTCQLVVLEHQHIQVLQVPEGRRDVPCGEGGKTSVRFMWGEGGETPVRFRWSVGADDEKWENTDLRVYWSSDTSAASFPDSRGTQGCSLSRKGTKKQRNSDGQWALTTTKNKNCTCQLVVLEHQHFQVL